MKWSVLGLIIAGAVAALCAALLVVAIRAGASGGLALPNEVSVVRAVKDIEAFNSVSGEDLEVVSVPRDEAPEGYISHPSLIIGRAMNTPVLKGQIVTRSTLVPEGSGHSLAAKIPEGMRAVSVFLTGDRALGQLIYPGCSVDVLVGFEVSGGKGKDANQGVLVENVEVLAVEDRMLTEPEGREDAARKDDYRRQQMVTLLVTPDQANDIQLAIDHGSVSLALRNPGDTTPVNRSAAQLSDIRRDPSVASRGMPGRQFARLLKGEAPPSESGGTAAPTNMPDYWQTEVIRGSNRDMQQFEVDKGAEPVEADGE